jgi:hypothetical protein
MLVTSSLLLIPPSLLPPPSPALPHRKGHQSLQPARFLALAKKSSCQQIGKRKGCLGRYGLRQYGEICFKSLIKQYLSCYQTSYLMLFFCSPLGINEKHSYTEPQTQTYTHTYKHTHTPLFKGRGNFMLSSKQPWRYELCRCSTNPCEEASLFLFYKCRN